MVVLCVRSRTVRLFSEGCFEVKEAVLSGGREVVDESGFLEVIEGWR